MSAFAGTREHSSRSGKSRLPGRFSLPYCLNVPANLVPSWAASSAAAFNWD
jgi:hypothetical protein